MSAFAKEVLGFLLLTLINLSLSSPHVIIERSAPLLLDSKVEYALAENLESKNDIFEADNAEAGLLTDKKEFVENTEALKKELAANEAVGITPPEPIKEDVVTDSLKPENIKVDDVIEKDSNIKLIGVKGETKEDVAEHKYTLMPKPNGKDEKPFEGHFTPEEYGVVAEESEKEADDGKLEIGQIPMLLPPFLPHSIHMLLRPRTFGGTPLVPLPPAVDVSDRLPPIDADVIEESSETAVIEDVESGDKLVKGSSRVSGGHYDNPFSFGIPPLPMIPLHAILKDLSGESKLPGATESEVLDVKGKKMLLQKKFLSFPSDDKSRFHLRIMSVQPLEHVDPSVLKEIDVEKESKGDKGLEEKDILKEDGIIKVSKEEVGIGKEVIKKNTPPGEKVDLKINKEIEKRDGEDSLKKVTETEEDITKEIKHTEERKLFPQSDILKVSETQVSQKVFVKPEEKEMKKGSSEVLDLSKVEDKIDESVVQSHLLVAKDLKKEEASIKENNEDVVKVDGPKSLKESHMIEASEEKAIFSETEEKKVKKELKEQDTKMDMDIASKEGMLYEEKKKISDEKEKKELLNKKVKKEKKCKCEEKDSDSDSDEEDED